MGLREMLTTTRVWQDSELQTELKSLLAKALDTWEYSYLPVQKPLVWRSIYESHTAFHTQHFNSICANVRPLSVHLCTVHSPLYYLVEQ
jgi:hypothetical protein